jgi:hypothetical protein
VTGSPIGGLIAAEAQPIPSDQASKKSNPPRKRRICVLQLRQCVKPPIDLFDQRLVAGSADSAISALEIHGRNILGQSVGRRKKCIDLKTSRQTRLHGARSCLVADRGGCKADALPTYAPYEGNSALAV